MSPTREFTGDSINSERKKTFLFLALTFILLLFRIIELTFNKFEVQSILVSRSFLGNGYLSKPMLSELLLAVLIILLLYEKGQIQKPQLADIKAGIINSLWFLSFPVITGLCLFTFTQEYYIKFHINGMLLLRWLYFVLAFVAANKIINLNTFHKFFRVFFVILILILTGFLQDFTSNSDHNSTIMAFLSGVGLTQVFSIIAFRNTYKSSFWTGLFSAMVTGFFVCFFVFGAVSGSYFTLFIPSIALLLAAISMHGKSFRKRVISLLSVSLASLLLSLILPSLFPPQNRDLLRENKKAVTKYHEIVYGIQINYNDTTTRRALTQIARLLQAANQVSRDNFGISPDLKWVTIYGYAPGGLNGVFPQGIEGNFVSQQYVNLILDSAFLNKPGFSPQFPDPVNAILHEYSHLFGIFPYQKWTNTESEGWATFSATRLSKLIYQKYGASLWTPAYNYAKIADSINTSLLAGHPLVWSHPEEPGAFAMWNSYEQKAGLENAYRVRWQYTSRDERAISYQKNSPSVVNDFIRTEIGDESFARVSKIPSVKFEDLYKPEDWKIFGHLANRTDEEMNNFFNQMKMRETNFSVPAPENNSPAVEIILLISSLILFLSGKLALKNGL